MKHIKRFNEELSPSTYRNAGMKLMRKFKEERGRKMIDYGNEQEFGIYNIHFANSSTIIKKSATFTNPSVNFYFQSISYKGTKEVYKDAEELVSDWKLGNCDLVFTICFSFQATEETRKLDHSQLKLDKTPIFSFEVSLSDWSEGLEAWNYGSTEGEEYEEQDTYEMFLNSFYPSIRLVRPDNDYYYGIFADRQSALKFKRNINKLIEPISSNIFDIISAISGDATHYEEIMNLFDKISINGLYDNNPPNQSTDKRWYVNNILSS